MSEIQIQDCLKKNNRVALEKFVFKSGKRYWSPTVINQIYKKFNIFPKSYALFKDEFIKVEIPKKFLKFETQGITYIYVDKNSINNNEPNSQNEFFYRIDWIRICFIYLSSFKEAIQEIKTGPIHSYESKIEGIKHHNFYDYAWVNRIFLILRTYFSIIKNSNENLLFGEKPKPRVYITHDIDVLEKKIPTRLKGTFIEVLNFFRFGFQLNYLKKALNYLFSNQNYFDSYIELIQFEKEKNLKPIYFLNSGRHFNNFKSIFVEPTYNLDEILTSKLVNLLKKNNFDIGLHPSYFSWNNFKIILSQKSRIEKKFNIKITQSRQHWLRFSIFKTFSNIEKAGILFDFSYGFNDKYGFRNGSCLKIIPWNFNNKSLSKIKSIPLVIMDSQLFHYNNLNFNSRKKIIDRIINEIINVGGEASILWHPHTFSTDYNWRKEFLYLVSKIMKIS